MSEPTNDPKLAAAEAKAAKARAKALRPWFKKKRFIVPIALVLLVGISQAAGGGKSSGGSNTNNTDTNNSAEETPEPKTLGIGDVAVDGKFSFTVSSVKCGIKSVGTKYLGKKPQGQFCAVVLQVENTGKEPETMFADNQKIFDDQDREFAPDTSAMIYMKDGGDAWVKEINPGNTLNGTLLFDLPKDATPKSIELHENAFSTGVTVVLQ